MFLPFVPDGAYGATSPPSSGRTALQGRLAPCPGDQQALALGHPRVSKGEQPCSGCQALNGGQHIISEKFYLHQDHSQEGDTHRTYSVLFNGETCLKPEEHRPLHQTTSTLAGDDLALLALQDASSRVVPEEGQFLPWGMVEEEQSWAS